MNEFKPDWDAMAVMVAHSQEQAAKIEQLEKQLAVQTYTVADPVREMLFALQDRIDALEAQKLQDRNATDELYNELLFAVGSKYPDETRHQTALRYIKRAEIRSANPAKAAHNIKEGT